MTATLRALVVDDDIAIRLLVACILQRRLFVVDTARDGAEAIEKLAAAEYSVVILDLMMPRVDGAGVLRYLAGHQPAQLATVIVMSAAGASATEDLTPQPAHFLEKPFDVDALLRAVRACTESSGTPPPHLPSRRREG